MSVLDSGTIDGMTTDENGKALILLISDHLDWKNEYDHLLRLQEKINSYNGFQKQHILLNLLHKILILHSARNINITNFMKKI